MYKLLIVDDEYIEIEALEYVIRNSSLPIETIFTANNGREAIKLAHAHKPDFVLMDIKMPGISGIEAAAIIKDSQPLCKIIFLSAYNYFNYAKEAIRLKASDFLIKPVPDDELITVINQLIVESKKESLDYDTNLTIENKFKLISSFFENELINALLFSDIKEAQILEYLKALNCEPKALHVLVMAFAPSSLNELSSLKETMLKRRSLKVIKEGLAPVSTNCFGNYNKNYIYLLITVDEPISKNNAQDILNKINTSIKKGFFLKNNVVISPSFTDVMEINPMLLQHKHELLNHTNEDVIVFPNISLHHNKAFSNKKEHLLLEAIKLNNTSLCLSLGKEYVQWLKNQNLTLIETKFHLYGLLSFIIKSVGESTPHSLNELNKLIAVYSKKLESVDNIETIDSCFIDQLLAISSIINSDTTTPNSSVTLKLCHYIDVHYRENLTLKNLSEEIHMNSQYISKLFKEEIGITFSDYLTDIRINKAKELLVSTHQTIQEIGIYVGYHDPNYFTRAFKKRESITPNTYRKKASTLRHSQSDI